MEGKLTLRSSDNELFEIDEDVALQSKIIKTMIVDDGVDRSKQIPLWNIESKVLAKVFEYCKKHAEAKSNNAVDGDLKSWDKSFIEELDIDALYGLIRAANFLDIESLMDLTCQRVADMISGKNVEEMRQMFNIENDFTPEEEAEIKKENQWTFE